jgi:tripartite-type tricarboxylate transporter receptor subunit TctC
MRKILVAVLALWATSLCAQPTKPVRILIGFPPGGALDSSARIVAEQMAVLMKHPVIVEARLGSGGLQGINALKSAAPDGMTLMIAPGSTTVLRALSMKKPPFDPFTDFVGVALVGQAALAMAVNSAVPAKTLREWADWARANPAQMMFSTGGAGGQTHFFGLMIGDALGVPLRHIPYKGTGPAIADTAAGHVPATVQPLGALLPMYRGGKLKVIAISGSRTKTAPDVPTFAEQGFPQLGLQAWYAIYAPGATPPDVVERLNTTINTAIRNEAVREKLLALDLTITEMSAAQLAAFIKSDHQRWQPVIKASGFSEDSD